MTTARQQGQHAALYALKLANTAEDVFGAAWNAAKSRRSAVPNAAAAGPKMPWQSRVAPGLAAAKEMAPAVLGLGATGAILTNLARNPKDKDAPSPLRGAGLGAGLGGYLMMPEGLGAYIRENKYRNTLHQAQNQPFDTPGMKKDFRTWLDETGNAQPDKNLHDILSRSGPLSAQEQRLYNAGVRFHQAGGASRGATTSPEAQQAAAFVEELKTRTGKDGRRLAAILHPDQLRTTAAPREVLEEAYRQLTARGPALTAASSDPIVDQIGKIMASRRALIPDALKQWRPLSPDTLRKIIG